MPFVKGEIIWVENQSRERQRLKHPAVVWQEEFTGDGDFIGVMITHTAPRIGFNNIPMSEFHFEKDHEVEYDNSHFVNQLFQKFHNWGPFHSAGKLTVEGINFIEDNLSNLEITEFEVYRLK